MGRDFASRLRYEAQDQMRKLMYSAVRDEVQKLVNEYIVEFRKKLADTTREEMIKSLAETCKLSKNHLVDEVKRNSER